MDRERWMDVGVRQESVQLGYMLRFKCSVFKVILYVTVPTFWLMMAWGGSPLRGVLRSVGHVKVEVTNWSTCRSY